MKPAYEKESDQWPALYATASLISSFDGDSRYYLQDWLLGNVM